MINQLSSLVPRPYFQFFNDLGTGPECCIENYYLGCQHFKYYRYLCVLKSLESKIIIYLLFSD